VFVAIMSALQTAESRILRAVGRLEAALTASLSAPSSAAVATTDDEQKAMLQAQCEGLRHELVELRQRHAALVSVLEQLDDRLDGALARVEEMVGD
jgi:hypothetical protein